MLIQLSLQLPHLKQPRTFVFTNKAWRLPTLAKPQVQPADYLVSLEGPAQLASSLADPSVLSGPNTPFASCDCPLIS